MHLHENGTGYWQVVIVFQDMVMDGPTTIMDNLNNNNNTQGEQEEEINFVVTPVTTDTTDTTL